MNYSQYADEITKWMKMRWKQQPGNLRPNTWKVVDIWMPEDDMEETQRWMKLWQ